MTELVVGIKHVRDDIPTVPIFASEMSVVGLIGTAPDANEAIFPLNTPIFFTTNDQAKRTALGLTGTLPDAVKGVADQLGVGQIAAKIVVVLVEEGADTDETIANIVGNEGSRTGIWAFLDSPYDLGVTPRLIAAPGFTSQFTQNGVIAGTITAAGSGGTNGAFPLAFTGGTGSGAAGTFTVAGGKLTAIAISDPGEYTVAPSFSFAASANLAAAAATVVLGAAANPIVAAIPALLDRLRAQFFPDGPTSRTAWLAYIETIQSDRVCHPLRNDALITDADGDIVTRPMSPRIIGIYVRRDFETDGRPFQSAANQAVRGIVGVSPPIDFSYTDASVEGQEILGFHGGAVFKGEVGVEDAVAEGGFVFWGTDNCGADPNWQMVNVMRGRDYIELGHIKSLRYYLGRFRITVACVLAIVESMRKNLQFLKNTGDILGYEVNVDPDMNPAEQLKQGNIWVMFKAEEAPVLKKITISSRRYPEALDAVMQSVAQQLGSATSTSV